MEAKISARIREKSAIFSTRRLLICLSSLYSNNFASKWSRSKIKLLPLAENGIDECPGNGPKQTKNDRKIGISRDA